jgi:hypothetical protein
VGEETYGRYRVICHYIMIQIKAKLSLLLGIKSYGAVEAQLHAFLTLALYECKWPDLLFGYFTSEGTVALDKWLGGSQYRSGCYGEGKNISPGRESNPDSPKFFYYYYLLTIRLYHL